MVGIMMKRLNLLRRLKMSQEIGSQGETEISQGYLVLRIHGICYLLYPRILSIRVQLIFLKLLFGSIVHFNRYSYGSMPEASMSNTSTPGGSIPSLTWSVIVLSPPDIADAYLVIVPSGSWVSSHLT